MTGSAMTRGTLFLEEIPRVPQRPRIPGSAAIPGWQSRIVLPMFDQNIGHHERHLRSKSKSQALGFAADFDPRRARAQSQEHRRRHPARPAGGVHRPVRLGQVVARLRHHLCRGPAPLCREPVGLCPPVPRDDAEAGRRPDRRPVAGDLDRAEDHLEEPALDRRHRHRDLRLHAPAVGARRRALFARHRPADREPDRQRRWSTASWRCRKARGSICWRRSCAAARASTARSSPTA